MSPAAPGRLFALALVAILVLAGALRLPGLSRPAWLDEAHSFTPAADPTLALMVRNSLVDRHPPLYFAALRGWIAVFGPSDTAARLFSLVLTLGSLAVLLGTIGARSPAASLSAGVLFATNPLLVRYGTEIRSYALLVLLALIVAAATWRLAKAPASRSARATLLVAPLASRAPRPGVRILLIEPIDAPMAPEAARYRDEAVAAARRAFGEPDEESANGLLYDARWHPAPGRR